MSYPEQRPSRRKKRMRGILTTVTGAIVAAVTLAGCTNVGTPDASKPPVTDPSSTPDATSTEAPAPVLLPDGTATDNLPLFTSVVNAVWGSPDNVSGRAYIDALVAVGFDKSAMQLTPDMSTVGNAAESIQFSVRWGDECLVGQVGPSTGSAVSVVLPGLPEGGCLVGSTRPIDW